MSNCSLAGVDVLITFAGASGGVPVLMVRIGNYVAKNGGNVTIATVDRDSPFLERANDSIDIIQSESNRARSLIPLLVRYCRRREVDVIVSAQQHVNILASLVQAVVGVADSIVVVQQNNLSRVVDNAEAWGRFLISVGTRVTYPLADEVVSVSSGVRRDLNDTIGCASRVIVNPAYDESIIEKAKDRPEHEWYQSSRYTLLVTAGRLARQKDYATLIDSFEKLMNHERQFRLIIFGKGPLREDLKEQLRSKRLEAYVDLFGFTPNPYPFIQQADVFVLSSRWEGLPTALVEAMALGTHVVSTDCPSGPREVLDNGKYGRLVPVRDPSALAKAIRSTLEAPVCSRQELRARARNYSIDRVGKEYADLIAQLAH